MQNLLQYRVCQARVHLQAWCAYTQLIDDLCWQQQVLNVDDFIPVAGLSPPHLLSGAVCERQLVREAGDDLAGGLQILLCCHLRLLCCSRILTRGLCTGLHNRSMEGAHKKQVHDEQLVM